MRKKMKNPGRKALAAGAVGLAAAAMVFGATTAANAATGHDNAGIRSLQLVPTSPATSFAAPGTPGVMRWNGGDGTAAGSFNLISGDQHHWVFKLPEGMKFADNVCDGRNVDTPGWNNDCYTANNGRDLWWATGTAVNSGPYTQDHNIETLQLPVISTGIIKGGLTGTYSPWTGLTTQAASATVPQSSIPGAGNFAATGATGPGSDGNYTLTGTAQPGAEIEVKDSTGAVVGIGTADSNGNWTVPIPAGTKPPLSITQKVGDVVSAPIEFNTAPLPVMNGVVAAGAIALAGLGFGGARLLRRSRVTA